MTHVLYFAYGIDMHPEEMRRLCPGARIVGTAVLADHRLAFFGHSRVWDGAEETVVAAAGETVHGVVYRLPPSEADQLEAARGVRLNGTGSYFHYPVDVTAEDRTSFAAVLLKKDQLGSPRLPSRPCLERIVEGASLQRLPTLYTATLAALPSVEARFPVPRRPEALMLVTIGCAC